MDLESKTPEAFETHGFLAKEMANLRKTCKAAHSDWFDLAERLNRLCQETIYQLNVKNEDGQGISQVALFVHILQTYQGAIICLSTGMESQALMLVRSAIEATFKLKAITVDTECVLQYADEARLAQIKFGELVNKSYLEHGTRFFSEDEVKEARDHIRGLKSELKKLKEEEETKKKSKRTYRRWGVGQWAEYAGLTDIYLIEYPLFCQPVHATADHLDAAFVKTNDGKVSELNPLPRFRLVVGCLHSAMNALLIALECVEPLAKKKRGYATIKTRRKQILKQLHKVATYSHKADTSLPK